MWLYLLSDRFFCPNLVVQWLGHLPFGTRLGAGGTPAYAAAVTVADFETKKDEVFAKFRRNRSFSSSSIHMLFDRHWCLIAVAGLDHTKWHGTDTCDSLQTYRRNRLYFLKDKQDFFLFSPWTDTCTWVFIWHRTCAKLLDPFPPLFLLAPLCLHLQHTLHMCRQYSTLFVPCLIPRLPIY